MITLGQTTVSLELREVFKHGTALRVGTRAFDILELLIRSHGRLVTKDEILQRVWPQTVVEENNLQVHISALRKALGSDRDLIRTIPGRGYVLLGGEGGEVKPLPTDNVVPERPRVEPPMPGCMALIGCDALFNEVCQALSVCALITLTGPGGIGKTALATEVAQCFVATQSSQAYFVSLAALKGPELLMDAMASALGIDCSSADPMPQTLINRLMGQPCLIILDNCEHLIETVASLVELLMCSCPSIRVLATSREPLRIAHERNVRVPPLRVPDVGADRQATLDCASVQLVLRHLRALDGCFAQVGEDELDNQSVDLIGEVCRRLEGLPLALQMAAARAVGLGLYEMVASLGQSMHLLTSALRNAPPRHQTLQASLSWSLRLLDDDELAVLERLSQLQGQFTLSLACDAVQDREIGHSRVLDCIVGLALKSLLTVTAKGPFRFYCVPESTRACLKRTLQERSDDLPCETTLSVGERAASGPELLSMAVCASSDSGPPGPSSYHASHQRMLAASQ
ncbi:MAG TPA: winged helix-turn-helix domain-containing protein [Pseudomonas sp.]|uniref:ATP-binding protein n=1 Tax=Pseudomonas sp. TaxID=306 RepID=UPI002EDBB437